MMRFFHIVTFILLLTTSVFSQKFNFSYGAGGSERSNNVKQFGENNSLVVGNRNTAAFYAMLLDKKGDTIWTIIDDYIKSTSYGEFCETNDSLSNSFLLVGFYGDSIAKNSNIRITKVRKDGKFINSKTIDGSGRNLHDRAYAIRRISDTAFALLGWYYTDLAGNSSNSLLLLIDTSFSRWKTFEYGGNDYEFTPSFDLTKDGGYIIGGTTYSYGKGAYNLYLVKAKADGTKEWDSAYGGPYKDYGNSVIALRDGNYLLAGGSYRDLNGDNIDGILVKVKPNGDTLWQHCYGQKTLEEFISVKELQNGDLMVCGSAERKSGPAGELQFQGWGLKLNANGTKIWERNYRIAPEYDIDHYFYAMDLTDNGGMIMSGMVMYPPPRSNDFWVVRVDSMGCDSTNCVLVDDVEPEMERGVIKLYPQPNDGHFTLMHAPGKQLFLEIYTTSGACVRQITIAAHETESSIDVSELPAGMYSYILRSTATLEQCDKLVIIK